PARSKCAQPDANKMSDEGVEGIAMTNDSHQTARSIAPSRKLARARKVARAVSVSLLAAGLSVGLVATGAYLHPTVAAAAPAAPTGGAAAPMTPKTEMPNEARALSSAFA